MIMRARGFTLIELVVVISIIAILSAVALPRYIELQRHARVSKAQAIYGAVKTAATLAKARCEVDLASGNLAGCGSTPQAVDMDGLYVTITHRYPSADASGIDAAAQLSAREGLVLGDGGAAGTLRTYDIVGGADGRCRVTYVAPAALGRSPAIDIDTAGC